MKPFQFRYIILKILSSDVLRISTKQAMSALNAAPRGSTNNALLVRRQKEKFGPKKWSYPDIISDLTAPTAITVNPEPMTSDKNWNLLKEQQIQL